jgi:hypothetical protein
MEPPESHTSAPGVARDRRAIRLLLATLLVYAALVVTHLGEFWPFSIYPMFSRGGHPWSRTLVRDVTTDSDSLDWREVTLGDLPGEPFALAPNGIDQIDLANFVSKTEHWNAARVAGLERMFYDQIETKRLLVFRADGRIDEDDTVRITFVPYALLGTGGTRLNPTLPR